MTPLRPPVRTAPTRQVVAAALTLLVLGAVGAVKAGLAGGDFMFDLEQAQPPLATVAPAVVESHTPRLARRVFLVIVDGLRLDKSYDLPFLDELRRRGVDTEAQSHYPTWSRPNYVTILTGVPPSASGVRTNHHTTPVALDSLMDRVNAAGLHAATATDYDVLPRLFLRQRANTSAALDDGEVEPGETPLALPAVRAPDADLVSPFSDARYAPWPGGFSEAGAALADGSAELVVLLVGAVDAAGHAHGGDSAQYREAAESADRALARALAHVDLAQDAVVVTADHGHTGRGGHGGVEPEVLTVPLVMAGAGIAAGATSPDARLVDIAPTVAALLGVPAPGHGLGRTLTELLALDPAQRAARQTTDIARLAVTRTTVDRAEAAAAQDELGLRAQRIGLVVGGALLATVLAILLIRRRVLRLDVRVLLVSVPAFFIVYYALIGTLGQRFSPSLLPAQGHLAATMAKYGIAAMVVQLAASLWALRNQGSLGERLAAANGIAWMGLMLAMVPAGLAWAFFPPPYVTVPGPFWLVVIPAVEVAVACAAVDVALTLLVEVIVFVARAWHRDATPIENLD
ncbi:MAG TPA: alkaline phosphatase family protein [Kofleriaceae bacterium]|nr:alkaline phosphatase family protein [Kofleriaceae bacterium]